MLFLIDFQKMQLFNELEDHKQREKVVRGKGCELCMKNMFINRLL
jgi:hypothetical protein